MKKSIPKPQWDVTSHMLGRQLSKTQERSVDEDMEKQYGGSLKKIELTYDPEIPLAV